MDFEIDEEQLKRAEEIRKKKQPKVIKNGGGIIFDSANYEL